MDLYDLQIYNFGPYEDVRLMLYQQGLVWITGENRDTNAADNNGCGKTGLFRALTWCLWGETIDGEKGDKVIREGQTSARVEVRLREAPKQFWTIWRERRKGSPKLGLTQPDGNGFKADKKAVQDKINELLGLDYHAFKNTVLYGQGDISRFAHPRTKDADRKAMLHCIMRTDILTRAHKVALERAKAQRKAIEAKQAELDKAEARMGEHDIPVIAANHASWEAYRKENIARFRDNAKEWKAKADELLEVPEMAGLEDVDQLNAELSGMNIALDEARAAMQGASKLADLLNKADEVRYGLENKIERQKTQLEQIDEQLKALDGDTCPLCESPLTEGHGRDQVRALGVARRTANVQLKQLKLKHKKAEAERAERKVAYDHELELTEQVTELAHEMEGLRERIKAAESVLERARQQRDQFIEKAKGCIEQAKGWATQGNPYEEQLEAARKKVAHLKKVAKKLKVELKAEYNELAYLEFWVRGFSNQGMPSYMLDSVMPYITERANHYLETLADGDIKMVFDTQRELKSSKGDYRDEIDIQWEVEGVADSYPPSGGQLKKMEIAADLALMDLVASREGGRLDLLMLDEVLDGLDAEGCHRVIRLLQELRRYRGTIFVISHEAEVSEAFEKAITAIKEGGVTTVTGLV